MVTARRRVYTLLILAILLASLVPMSIVTAETFDNSGDGKWVKYVSFAVKTVPTEYAQYRIEINGTTWRLYNALGGLEAEGEVADFWNKVKSDGSDIRVFDQNFNQLYFFIEEWDYSNQYVVIWVRVEAGIKQLNIAYGNPDASASSYNDPTKVFELFDDADEIRYVPTGAWCWINDPKAVYANGKTFFGAVEKNGDVVIYSYDHATGKLEKYVLHSALQVDDHAVPAILLLPNGSLMVFYSAHGGTTLYYRVSTNPYDISSWSPEYTYSVPDKITYPVPVYLPAENRIYVFFRTGQYLNKWAFIYSDDMGSIWSDIIVFYEMLATSTLHQYFKIISNGYDKIYFAHSGHPAHEHTGVYFMYYYNGSFYMMNGTKIADLPSGLPIHREQMELVYNWTETGRYAWVWDIALDENENPVIVFATFASETEHFYYYARWNGTAWEVHEITFAGGSIDGSSEPYYSGGITIDKENVSMVYFSKQDPETGQFEIYKGITTDGGKTWIFEQLTENSPYENVRPVAVVNGTDIQVIWMYGVYNHYTDFDTVFRNGWNGFFNATWGAMYGVYDVVFDTARNSNVIHLSEAGSWGADGRSVLLSPIGFSDVVFDFYARTDVDGGSVGLAFCIQDSGNYYFALYDASVDKVKLIKYSGGTGTELANSFPDDGKWHRYTVVKAGSTLKVLVDGQEVISVTDTEFASGKFGLRAYGTGNQMWDNIKVLKASDPADFGLPEVRQFYIVKKVVQLEKVLYIEYVDVDGTLITLTPPVNLTLSSKEKMDFEAITSILNVSQTNITVKLHSKMELVNVTLNDTSLNVSYIGNETIGGEVFNVYNVTSVGNGTLKVIGALPNVLWNIQIPRAVVIGDTLTVSFSRQVNASIKVPVIKEYTWSGIIWGGENFSIVNESVVMTRSVYSHEDFSNISDWTVDIDRGGTPTIDSSIGKPAPSVKLPDTVSTEGIALSKMMLPASGEYVFEGWIRIDPTSTSGGAVYFLSTPGTGLRRLGVYFLVDGSLEYSTFPGGTETKTTFASSGTVGTKEWYRVLIFFSNSNNKASIYVYNEGGSLVAQATNIDVSGEETSVTTVSNDVAIYSTVTFTGDAYFDEIKVYERKIRINATPGFDAYLYANGSLIAAASDDDNDGIEEIDISWILEPINATLKIRSTVSSEEVSFNNTNVITYEVKSFETHVLEALVEDYDNLDFGYIYIDINVIYGKFEVLVKDLAGATPDYEPITIIVENATTNEIIAEVAGYRHALDRLVAGIYRIKVLFRGVNIAEDTFNLTTTSTNSIFEVTSNMLRMPTDYRGLRRSMIAPKDVEILSYESLTAKHPFGKTRLLINGFGSFMIYINYENDLPTKVKVVGNVTNLEYHWDGSYLVITGSLGSVGELNITDLYRLRLEIYDRLNNSMPSWIYAYVNESKYSGAVVEDYLYPEDYVVKLPSSINGFEFYAFFDGYNESTRAVTINHTDVEFKAWYRVPTSIVEFKSFQITSLGLIPFIRQEQGVAKVYIEGYLRDYYGNGVPDRTITLNITCDETDYSRSYNVTTDASGYFRTPIIELVRGNTYEIEAVFGGDDIYVGTVTTTEIVPEELPAAPAVLEIPTTFIFVAIGLILVVLGMVAALRVAKHTIEDIRVKRRRFVKKKH